MITLINTKRLVDQKMKAPLNRKYSFLKKNSIFCAIKEMSLIISTRYFFTGIQRIAHSMRGTMNRQLE